MTSHTRAHILCAIEPTWASLKASGFFLLLLLHLLCTSVRFVCSWAVSSSKSKNLTATWAPQMLWLTFGGRTSNITNNIPEREWLCISYSSVELWLMFAKWWPAAGSSLAATSHVFASFIWRAHRLPLANRFLIFSYNFMCQNKLKMMILVKTQISKFKYELNVWGLGYNTPSVDSVSVSDKLSNLFGYLSPTSPLKWIM